MNDFQSLLSRVSSRLYGITEQEIKRPVHFVAASALPPAYRVPGTYAFTAGNLAAELFGAAYKHDHAIVFSDEDIQRDSAAHVFEATTACAIHEMAHILEFAAGNAETLRATTPHEHRQLYHGPRWIRLAVHLSLRASEFRPILLSVVLGSSYPPARRPLAYAHALRHEAYLRPNLLRLASAAPKEFWDVWAEDLREYVKAQAGIDAA